MLIVLAALSLALVALGALVLLRFPDRPGGDVRLLGLEVSSVGAGLPLIALGVLVALVAFSQQREDGRKVATGASDGNGAQVAGRPSSDAGGCLTDFFADEPTVPKARQRKLPAEAEDVDVLVAHESKADEFGLVLTDRGEIVGAAKLTYDIDAKQTGIDAIVDASCQPIAWTAEGLPEPNPTLVGQYTTLRLDFGERLYLFELKPNGAYETELHRFRP